MRTRLSHAMFVVLALSSSAIAQNFSPDPTKPFDPALQQLTAPSPETYGTASEVAIAIPDMEFNPYTSTTTFAWNFGKYITSAFGELDAGVHLPAGASITRMELQACDTNPTVSGTLLFVEKSNSSGFGVVFAGINPGPNTGCTLFPVTLSVPHTVNNAINSYVLLWNNGNAFDGTVKIQAVRVYYKLQVSPPPGTARFTDVPTTHVFFQYIEALAASGITSGCTASTFCPDAPLTRGQMAVFLAKALGLHWAP